MMGSKIVRTMLHSSTQVYFGRKARIIYFEYGQTLIATVPLVMSTALSQSQRRLPIGFSESGYVRKICLCRPEANRILSAYNKKVLASKYDMAKRALLASTDLRHNMTFEEFLLKLISRKAVGGFIDRHFVPQQVLYGDLSETINWECIDIRDVETQLGVFAYKKSSHELSYHSSKMKTDLTKPELGLLERYLGTWT